MNGMAIFVFGSFLALLPPCAAFWTQSENYIRSHSEADREAATKAERLASLIEGIQDGNRSLATLRVTCASTLINPSIEAEIIAASTQVLATQESLSIAVDAFVQWMQIDGKVESTRPSRESPGPCQIPGNLIFAAGKDQNIYSFEGTLSGFRLSVATAYESPSWYFSHPDALPIE